MNGKWILLLVICMNIVSIIFANTSPTYNSNSINSSNSFVNNFFIIGTGESMTPSPNETFVGNVSSTLTGNTAAVASGGTLGGFIDGIKLVLGLMAILTPIPVIAVLFNLQLPIFFLMMISIPLSIMYIISMLEFLRGGVF